MFCYIACCNLSSFFSVSLGSFCPLNECHQSHIFLIVIIIIIVIIIAITTYVIERLKREEFRLQFIILTGPC
jgi:hypothetical protein